MSDEAGNQSVDRLVPIEHENEAANPVGVENLPSSEKSRRTADQSQGPKGQPDWARWRVLVAVVFGVLALLLGSGLLWPMLDAYHERKPPTFSVSCEGEQGSGACVYELTEELAFIDTLLGDFQISVSADYSGDGIVGPVEVRLLGYDSAMREKRRWDNFQTQHQDSLSFTLTASDLFEYSGLAPDPRALAPTLNDPPASQTGKFAVQVLHDGEVLATETITVLNTPWLHSTQLSDHTIRAGEPISAHVTVRNLGGPSRFHVRALLWEAVPGQLTSTHDVESTLEIGRVGWWPSEAWLLKDFPSQVFTSEQIDTDQAFTKSFTIPGSLFQGPRLYLLETYAVKELHYLDFPKGETWTSSEDFYWRARGLPQYLAIVVVADWSP